LVLAGALFTPELLAILGAFFLWGMASHAFGAVQDVIADRAGGIASIATAFGAATTVRLAVASYAAAGMLLLFAGWPAALASVLVLPYILTCLPFARLADADAERANRGWKKFLALNFVSGFLVTMLLIAWWAMTPGG
jgi:4-hydroxybenzoate polyprenyltransferase